MLAVADAKLGFLPSVRTTPGGAMYDLADLLLDEKEWLNCSVMAERWSIVEVKTCTAIWRG